MLWKIRKSFLRKVGFEVGFHNWVVTDMWALQVWETARSGGGRPVWGTTKSPVGGWHPAGCLLKTITLSPMDWPQASGAGFRRALCWESAFTWGLPLKSPDQWSNHSHRWEKLTWQQHGRLAGGEEEALGSLESWDPEKRWKGAAASIGTVETASTGPDTQSLQGLEVARGLNFPPKVASLFTRRKATWRDVGKGYKGNITEY